MPLVAAAAAAGGLLTRGDEGGELDLGVAGELDCAVVGRSEGVVKLDVADERAAADVGCVEEGVERAFRHRSLQDNVGGVSDADGDRRQFTW